MTSKAKIEANRRNAKMSTGPKSEIGKRRVSGNAISHGGYAVTKVLPFENQNEYNALVQSTMDYWQPQGAQELICAKQIADCIWRYQRIARAEMARHLGLAKQASIQRQFEIDAPLVCVGTKIQDLHWDVLKKIERKLGNEIELTETDVDEALRNSVATQTEFRISQGLELARQHILRNQRTLEKSLRALQGDRLLRSRKSAVPDTLGQGDRGDTA